MEKAMPHIMDNGELAENRPSPLVAHLHSWRLIVVIGSLCPGTFLLALQCFTNEQMSSGKYLGMFSVCQYTKEVEHRK